MSRRLDDLSPAMRARAVEFLAKLTEAKIPVLIVDTLRSPDEHRKNLAAGTSWVKHSRHLDGDAMDVCPYEIYAIAGRQKLMWDATNPVWERIAQIAESCGLVSGHRWKQRDSGHVELPQ